MCIYVHRIDISAAGKAGEMPQFRFPTCAASWLSSRVGFSCLASGVCKAMEEDSVSLPPCLTLSHPPSSAL